MARAACGVAVVVAGMAGLTGCVGDEEAAQPKSVKYSKASEPPRTFAERMARLLATTTAKDDCTQLNEISGRSLTRFPCPADKPFRRSMERFEVVGAQEYGTGAVIDYRSGKIEDGAALLLFVAPDRNWGVSRFGVVTEPSTKTSDKSSRAGFRKVIDAYFSAIRTRDCRAFAAVAFTGEDRTAKVCKTIFPTTRGLAKRLKANPTVKPQYEGGNATYGFFSYETSKPTPVNLTMSVAKDPNAPKSYLVLDGAPSPTTAQQREAAEILRRSRTDDEPETSQSRKVDGP